MLKNNKEFVALLGIQLPLSSGPIKNFIKEVPKTSGLLVLLGNIACGDRIEVSRITVLLLTN